MKLVLLILAFVLAPSFVEAKGFSSRGFSSGRSFSSSRSFSRPSYSRPSTGRSFFGFGKSKPAPVYRAPTPPPVVHHYNNSGGSNMIGNMVTGAMIYHLLTPRYPSGYTGSRPAECKCVDGVAVDCPKEVVCQEKK